MKLAFIHGWGFDPRFWDRIAPMLSEFEQERVDLGLFGDGNNQIDASGKILIGHSLGFVYGMRMSRNWAGWVAINSFPRFVHHEDKAGCVASTILRTMRQQLMKNPEDTLNSFYKLIGAPRTAPTIIHSKNLIAGLNELRDADIGDHLKNDTKPGLILAAQNDPLVPVASSENMATPHNRIAWHPTGGHMLPQSDAAWCATAIKDFIHAHHKALQ